MQVIDSLKSAGGSVEMALKNELAAWPIDEPTMAKMTVEYATIR